MKKLLLKIAGIFAAIGSFFLGFFLFFRGRNNQEVNDHLDNIKEQKKENEKITNECDDFLNDNPPLKHK